MNKWTKGYWIDLGERVGTTAIYGVIAMLTADQSGIMLGTPEQWWAVVGLPTVLALLKGLVANMADADSGASLAPSPPGPVVVDEERGESALTVALVVLVVVVILVVLFGNLR